MPRRPRHPRQPMQESGRQWVGGIHAVRTALSADRARLGRLLFDEARNDRRLHRLLDQARRRGIAPQPVARDELDRLLPDTNHQGVLLDAALPTPSDERGLDELLSHAESAPLLLVLDEVQDPHNLGACLRSADAAGVLAVVAPRDRNAGLTPVTCKVASGAAEALPFVQVTNLARTLRRLQDEHGVWVVGLAGDADVPLYDLDLTGPLALVVGGEEKGLRRLTREHCDRVAALPMRGRVESLNVSVAAGIGLFEALRQREG